jgi:hypothetical protein
LKLFSNIVIVQTERISGLEFDVPRHGRIPKLGTVLRVNDFCVHVHGISRSAGSACPICTPDSTERMRTAV